MTVVSDTTDKLIVSVSFDSSRGYVASHPELREFVALSLSQLRRAIEVELLPEAPVLILNLDRAARRERDQRAESHSMIDDEGWRDDLHRDLSAGRRLSKRASPYDSREWKQRRAELKEDSICVLCTRFGLAVAAKVADHVTPHRDSQEGFEGALQPLCLGCHVIKRKVEGRWRRGELGVNELNLAISKEGARLRAAAFGVGVDGFQLVRVD